MPIAIGGTAYYRTGEVCQIVGISRNTFFRWLREGTFDDVENVDRRGWRLFTEDDLDRLREEANRVKPNDSKARRKVEQAPHLRRQTRNTARLSDGFSVH